MEALIQEIEQEASLEPPQRLRKRIDAHDRLESALLGTQQPTGPSASSEEKRLRKSGGRRLRKTRSGQSNGLPGHAQD